MTKHGGHEWKARGHQCSLDLFFLMILSLIPHLSWKLRSPYGTNFDSRDMLSDRMQAVECSDFIFVAGMYPEIENGKHMGSLKEQL